jgi:hypothetical protein
MFNPKEFDDLNHRLAKTANFYGAKNNWFRIQMSLVETVVWSVFIVNFEQQGGPGDFAYDNL